VLSSPSGAWGGLVLMREAESAHFTPAQAAFVAGLRGELAE
jgi:hypothetical protein